MQGGRDIVLRRILRGLPMMIHQSNHSQSFPSEGTLILRLGAPRVLSSSRIHRLIRSVLWSRGIIFVCTVNLAGGLLAGHLIAFGPRVVFNGSHPWSLIQIKMTSAVVVLCLTPLWWLALGGPRQLLLELQHRDVVPSRVILAGRMQCMRSMFVDSLGRFDGMFMLVASLYALHAAREHAGLDTTILLAAVLCMMASWLTMRSQFGLRHLKRARSWARDGRCVVCGYASEGSDRCSECGTRSLPAEAWK